METDSGIKSNVVEGNGELIEMQTICCQNKQTFVNFILYFFTGFFLSTLIFLSIAGNFLVCIAIYTERSLRRIGNLFLASLAIADLFVASLVMTFALVNDLLGEYILDFVDLHKIYKF